MSVALLLLALLLAVGYARLRAWGFKSPSDTQNLLEYQ